MLDTYGDNPCVKCVVAGDDAVGKTSMLISYATRKFPGHVIPDVFDNYAGTLRLGSSLKRLVLIDTSKQGDADCSMTTRCSGADVILLCFSVIQRASLLNVEQYWFPELRRSLPNVPVILVGTNKDLRDDPMIAQCLQVDSLEPVVKSECLATAERIGASGYLEFGPRLQSKIKRDLDQAIAQALSNKRKGRRPRPIGCKVM